MITLHDIARTPSLLVAKLRKLERQGRYDEALRDCLEIVEGQACVPALDGVTPSERAELLLRYGALIGFLGHNSQIADSQEQSKDLLTCALEEFSAMGDRLKTAECENYIALAYWRKGELNEASVWLNNSLERDGPAVSDTRLYSHIISGLINVEQKKFEDNVALFKPLERDFIAFNDPFLLGSFYTNLGISYNELAQTSDALNCLELARRHHEKARHSIYLGTVENNLAQIHRAAGDFQKAHLAVDNATRIFRKVKDKTREGFSLDTKARILLAEKRYSLALRTIDRSLEILGRGENDSYLVESMMTRVAILLHMDRFVDSVMGLVDAVNIVRVNIGEDAAKELIVEFESALASTRSRDLPGKKGRLAEARIELLLPPALSNYSSYSGIWVNSANLEIFGLQNGSLAILVDEKVKRGDLIAVETEDGSVKCGIYDRDFGLVCLERGDEEPELYDENTVKVLGKIVGVADKHNDHEGPMSVRPVVVSR